MYIGVKTYDYKLIDFIEFENMFWDLNDSNYMNAAMLFIEEYFDQKTIFHFKLKTLLSLILENVHDHGSGSCIMKFGVLNNFKTIEVYEPLGGFDLTNLPNGTGGCGFREIKRSKCIISHNPKGDKTFILIETNLVD
ncbi:hypothetical protein [Brumimicrobium sp.]|uniref:hypothetical protein n=1 Tax=Brumimicrobium sp. TaxID=2029867 RepID=UPI003A8CF7EC